MTNGDIRHRGDTDLLHGRNPRILHGYGHAGGAAQSRERVRRVEGPGASAVCVPSSSAVPTVSTILVLRSRVTASRVAAVSAMAAVCITATLASGVPTIATVGITTVSTLCLTTWSSIPIGSALCLIVTIVSIVGLTTIVAVGSSTATGGITTMTTLGLATVPTVGIATVAAPREGSGNSDSVISGSLASSAPPRGGQ